MENMNQLRDLLDEVEDLLKEILDEEYEADNLLTELAESRVNERASNDSCSVGSGSSRQRGRPGSRLAEVVHAVGQVRDNY
jgi:hypothetical protein